MRDPDPCRIIYATRPPQAGNATASGEERNVSDLPEVDRVSGDGTTSDLPSFQKVRILPMIVYMNRYVWLATTATVAGALGMNDWSGRAAEWNISSLGGISRDIEAYL